MLFGSAQSGFSPGPVPHPVSRPLRAVEIILEQGRYKNFWIDISRTAHIGPASQAYKAICGCSRTARLALASSRVRIQKSATSMASPQLDPPENCWLWRIPGLCPSSPVPYPGTGLRREEGFIAKEGMVISIDCLYFGKLGPSHMENVFIVTEDGAEPLISSR